MNAIKSIAVMVVIYFAFYAITSVIVNIMFRITGITL